MESFQKNKVSVNLATLVLTLSAAQGHGQRMVIVSSVAMFPRHHVLAAQFANHRHVRRRLGLLLQIWQKSDKCGLTIRKILLHDFLSEK
jgi:hypothetical protein